MPRLVALLLVAASSGCAQRVEVGLFRGEGGAGGAGGSGGSGGSTFVPLERSSAAIGAASSSTCARTSSGGVACWGNNTAGELGVNDQNLPMSEAPLTPNGLAGGVLAVFGGGSAHCAIRDDGRVLCWGASLYGEFDGMPVQAYVLYPLEQPGVGDDTVQLALGLYWGCALSREGKPKCWGFGGSGQLGNGSTDDAYVPRDVAGSERYVHVAASNGGFHNCGATSFGGVLCWGDNADGQLGAPGPNQTVPVPVTLEGAVEVAAGSSHSCARNASGEVWCWGDGSSGQLGGAAGGPVKIGGLPVATALAAGGDQSCIVSDTGAVWCWGMIEPFGAPSPPTEVIDASFAATGVACGGLHGCAINGAHAVRCWGANDRGQTGGGQLSL